MPLACGHYAVEYVLAIRSISQTSWWSAAVNSLPLSLWREMGAPCFKTQSWTMASATVSASLPQIARPSTYLVKWSCITTMYSLPSWVLLKGPIRSTETLSLKVPCVDCYSWPCPRMAALYLPHTVQHWHQVSFNVFLHVRPIEPPLYQC